MRPPREPHEQNRDDRLASSGCTASQLASGAGDDDLTVPDSTFETDWDPASVMNDCNPTYWDRHLAVAFDTTRFGR